MSDIVEDLIAGKLSSPKYVENVETEYGKTNLVNMGDEKESVERDDINKNDYVTLTDVDEESDEIGHINRKEQGVL